MQKQSTEQEFFLDKYDDEDAMFRHSSTVSQQCAFLSDFFDQVKLSLGYRQKHQSDNHLCVLRSMLQNPQNSHCCEF